MQCNREKHRDCTVLRIGENRLDAALAPELKTYLLGVIEDGATKLGLDMTRVRFIDSSGLAAIVAVMKRLGRGGSIVLWGLSPEVRYLFELTQLYKLFQIYESENDALA